MSFPQGFEITKKGQFFNPSKLAPGKYKIRPLTDWIAGNETWINDADGRPKPVRCQWSEHFPQHVLDMRRIDDEGQPSPVKEFIACAVWNYQEETLQVFSCDKSSINLAIQQLENSEEWGDTKSYDLIIEKTGAGMNTKYTVTPCKPKEAPVEAIASLEMLQPDMSALFRGEYPMKSE